MNVRIPRLFVLLAIFASVAMMGCRGECVTCPGGKQDVAGADGCRYNVVSLLRLYSSQGGNGGFSVTTDPQSCTWTTRSNDPWITLTSGHSGTGNGEANFRVVGSNDSRGRTGSITVSGQGFTENITIQQNPR